MFGQQSATNTFGRSTTGGLFSTTTTAVAQNTNPNKDFEVTSPPNDTVQALKFSPASVPTTFLASGSWDNNVRVWEINQDGTSAPKAEQFVNGPVLEIDWSDDGSKLFIASADKTVRAWDLASNQMIGIGQHDQPVKTCHWVKTPNASYLMTGSWDKTLRFWDPRQPGQAASSIQLQERVYCADVVYPMAAVALANRNIHIYNLEPTPREVKAIESPLKFQSRCIAICKDKTNNMPNGFALGSIEGRVAIQYVETSNPKDNFTFKCHRSTELNNGFQDIFAVNDIAFHPTHQCTLATVGSDGRYSFWDKESRTKLKSSEAMPAPVTRCCISATGQVFAYAVGYDWSKGHEYYNAQAKNSIFVRPCMEDMKPRPKK